VDPYLGAPEFVLGSGLGFAELRVVLQCGYIALLRETVDFVFERLDPGSKVFCTGRL
jgi:hypothetical protein